MEERPNERDLVGLLQSGMGIEGLAAHYGKSTKTVKRWLFMYGLQWSSAEIKWTVLLAGKRFEDKREKRRCA